MPLVVVVVVVIVVDGSASHERSVAEKSCNVCRCRHHLPPRPSPTTKFKCSTFDESAELDRIKRDEEAAVAAAAAAAAKDGRQSTSLRRSTTLGGISAILDRVAPLHSGDRSFYAGRRAPCGGGAVCINLAEVVEGGSSCCDAGGRDAAKNKDVCV